MSKRILAFDVAKLVAILAVIVGHTAIRFSAWDESAIGAIALSFSFHLPLFFIVSGYFLPAGGVNLRKEASSLLMPYAAGAAVIVAGICFANLFLHDQGSTKRLFIDWFSAAVYGAGDIPAEGLAVWPQVYRIGGLWFLLALFWARFVAAISFKTKAPYLICVAAFVAGLVSSRYVYLPFDVQSGLCAVPFVMVGVYARRFGIFDRGAIPPYAWACLTALWLWAVLDYKGLSMAMCFYGSSAVDYARNICGAIAGAFCVIGTCCALGRSCVGSSTLWVFLAKLGGLTLTVLCVHIFEDDVLRWGSIVDAVIRLQLWGGWLSVAVFRCLIDLFIAYGIHRALLAMNWSSLCARFVAR